MEVSLENKSQWREAAIMTLNILAILLFASSLALLAQAAVSEAEKWIAPVMMGLTNLFGSVFAFLTARELRLNDAEKKIMKADYDRSIAQVEECREEREEMKLQLERANKQITRLMRRAGLPEEDSDEDAEKKRGSKARKPLPPEAPNGEGDAK